MNAVYFSAIDWAFRKQGHQHISAEIARRGGRVLFVENTGVRWPSRRDLPRVGSRLARLARPTATVSADVPAGVTVVTPQVLPVTRSALVRRANRASLLRQLRGHVPALSTDPPVVWVGLPNWTSVDVATSLDPRLLVYWWADEFTSLPHVSPSIRDSQARLLSAADLVFVTSQRLKRLGESVGVVPIAVPNGVDMDMFRAAAERRLRRPAELDGSRGRIIGLVGGVNHKTDLEILRSVIMAFPEDTVVIVGTIEIPDFPRPANLRLLGERSHTEMPALMQHMDVCLIPYVLNDFTESVYPAKMNEYLAAGRPVVATPLREVVPFADVVRMASGSASFVDQIRDALREPPSPAATEARLAVADRSSYHRFVPKMIDMMEAQVASKASGRT